MSDPRETFQEEKGEECDGIFVENSQDDTMPYEEYTPTHDVNAWRKRSIAFQRNPLLFRRMSQGEQPVKCLFWRSFVYCYVCIAQSVVLCLQCNMILFV